MVIEADIAKLVEGHMMWEMQQLDLDAAEAVRLQAYEKLEHLHIVVVPPELVRHPDGGIRFKRSRWMASRLEAFTS